jgi:alginate O-acetyltransferase complex protein AlgJ
MSNPAPTPDPLALPPVPPPAPADHLWRDRVVVALFGLALALPLVGAIVNRNVATTVFEQRRTAPWPDAPAALKSWRAWPTGFEAAFADRFGGRDLLISLHHRAKAQGFGVSPVPLAMIGRDGWLYFLGEDGKAVDRDYRGIVPYPPDQLAKSAAEIKRRHDFLAALGIPYVVMIVPDKATIYPEHLPRWVSRAAPQSRLDAFYAAMKAYPDVTVLDLRPALTAGKARERNYYKTDSHWNFLGATIGYEALAAVLKAKVPGFPAVPAMRPIFDPGIDVYSGDLANMIGLPRLFREDDLASLGRVLVDAPKRCAQPVAEPFPPGTPLPKTEILVYACDRAGLPSAVVFRDSMTIPLVPLISENFRRVVYVSGRRLDRALVEREKPDVVIEVIVERGIDGPASAPM